MIPFTLIHDLQLGFNKMHLKLEVSRTELNVALKADSGLGWSLVQPCRPHLTISRVPKHMLPAVAGRGSRPRGRMGQPHDIPSPGKLLLWTGPSHWLSL